MTTSKEAIAAAREIFKKLEMSAHNPVDQQDMENSMASIIQKHYAAKDRQSQKVNRTVVSQHNEIIQLKARDAELEKALCFFQSVIKSGEPWTEHCENTFKAAMEKQK